MLAHTEYAAQEALALTDNQTASICTEYAMMSDALNAVYAEQKAMLATTVEVGSQVLMTGQVCLKRMASICAFLVTQMPACSASHHAAVVRKLIRSMPPALYVASVLHMSGG